MPAANRHSQNRVYLDWAATAPFDTRLLDVVQEASWANASALYTEGRQAARQLNDARHQIAKALGAHAPNEIIFTSGGSESDNMMLRGLATHIPGANNVHVVISGIEHHAIEVTAASLHRRHGYVVDVVAPNELGIITHEALEETLDAIEAAGDATAVVSIQAVNNELGTIQPVRELAACAHKHGARFACDAVQALGKIPIDLEESGVDAASFSGHKIGAFKGCGLLYLRRDVRCEPLIYGGGQESGLRSGTSNVLGAVMLAQAVQFAVDEFDQNHEHLEELRARLVDGVAAGSYAHAIRPTLPEHANCIPGTIHFLIDDLEGETLVLRLDNAGIAASAGSACSSGSRDPSPVLLAIGIKREKAYGSLRLSMGSTTTEEDVDFFLSALPGVLR